MKYQHEPVIPPARWSWEDKRLVYKIDKLFDELYRRVGQLQDENRTLRAQLRIGGNRMIQLQTQGNTVTTTAEYMVANEADVENIPDDAPVGSIAYTASLSYIAIKNEDGEWENVIEDSAEGENDG